MMASNFWSGKTILLTGHTGFKGSWLSLWLQHLGARVVGISLEAPTQPNLFLAAQVADGMTSVLGDIRDLEFLQQVIKREQPEIAIHMAAQSLVRRAYAQPIETYSTNVMGTVNFLEAIRQTKTVRVALVVTSDKCYANQERVSGYQEDDLLGGDEPYANSKACAEMVCEAYRKSYFLNRPDFVLATARAGNVIGGGDWAQDRLVPDVISAFISQRPVVIRNPNAQRPWQHVLDVLNGYMILVEYLWANPTSAETSWNFGPEDAEVKPVAWMVDQLVRIWGGEASWTLDKASDNPPETHCLKLDSTRSRQLLGWHPRLNIVTSLSWIVNWYQQYQKDPTMRSFCEEEIRRYQGSKELICQ
jgi:CDP-glucose 4,6-dehydratase